MCIYVVQFLGSVVLPRLFGLDTHLDYGQAVAYDSHWCYMVRQPCMGYNCSTNEFIFSNVIVAVLVGRVDVVYLIGMFTLLSLLAKFTDFY